MIFSTVNIKRNHILLLSILLLVLILAPIAKDTFLHYNSHDVTHINNESPLSLSEAYDIALTTARNWDGQALLSNITSTDKPDISDHNEGIDGKRRFWNVAFTSTVNKKSYVFSIEDGKVVNEKEVSEEIPLNQLLEINKIKLDSPRALKLAKESFGLVPGRGWAKGYNFTLRRIRDNAILTVVGEDDTGHFARVHINYDTSDVISAERRVIYGGKLYNQNGLIDLPNNSSLLVNSGAISPNYLVDNIVILSAVVNPLSPESSYQILISHDSGKSWSSHSVDFYSYQVFFSDEFKDDHTIYSITQDNVYISHDDGNSWDKTFNTPMTILDFDTDGNTKVVLCTNKLYISSYKTLKWSSVDIPRDSYKVGVDQDGSIFILSSGKVYQRVNDKWINLDIPGLGNCNGIEVINRKLVCYNEKAIALLDLISDQWSAIDRLPGQITFLYKDSGSDNAYLFFDNNDVFKLSQGGDSIEKVTLPIALNNENLSFTLGQEGSLFFGTGYGTRWEQITK